MSERLPPRYFDRLTDSIWHLGQVGMRSLFEIAPTPGVVKGELYHDDLCLEPEFFLRHPYPELLGETPRHIELMVSEMEPYSKDESFTIYSYRRLILDTKRRSRSFTRGIVLLDDNGNSMTPQLDRSAVGKKCSPGSAQWRELHERTIQLNKDEADLILENVQRVTDKIYQDNLGV